MQPIMQAIPTFSAMAASCLISAIWQGSILAVCVAISLRLLPELPAAIRSWIWAAVFMTVIVLNLPHATSSQAMLSAPHASTIDLNFRWSLGILLFWVLLSLVRGLRLGIDWIRLRRIAKNACPIEATCLMKITPGAAPRSAEIYRSTDVNIPCVIGFDSPRILIPSSLLEELSPSQLEHIVLHELEHLRRRDDWMNLLQKLALVLFPLNPVLQWIDHRLCIERELACDEGVLRSTRAPKAYASFLANLAEHSLQRTAKPLALHAWGKKSELLHRVHRILRQQQTALMAKRPARIVTSLLMIGILGIAVILSHCPQLVGFANPAAPVRFAAAQPAQSVPVYREAVFHPGSVHSQFVKAVVPEGKPKQPASTRQPLPLEAGKRRFHRHPVASAVLVVTDWNELGVAQHLEFAVVESTRPSAYPTTRSIHEWLAIQL